MGLALELWDFVHIAPFASMLSNLYYDLVRQCLLQGYGDDVELA